MGGSKTNSRKKGSKAAAADSQEQPSASRANPASPAAYADWSGFQAYSPIPPPGFFHSNPQTHPYMWGPQHLMPPYGTPTPPYGMYPRGAYAHPSIPLGSHPFSPYAMPSPNGNAEASGALAGGVKVDRKSSDGKEKCPMKRSKGSSGSLNIITGESNNELGKTSGASANGGSQSGESGSEGSSEGSDATSQNDPLPKRSGGQDSFDGVPQNGAAASSSQKEVAHPSLQAMLNHPLPTMPMPEAGAPAGVSSPTAALNIGMDYWGAPVASPIVPVSWKVPGATVVGEVVPGGPAGAHESMPSKLWLQDERELKRQRTRQSPRESVCRSRLQKQVLEMMAQTTKSMMLDSTLTEINEDDEWEIKLKKIKCAVGAIIVYTMYGVAKATIPRQVEYVDRSILAQRDGQRTLLMKRLTRLSDRECREQLRMGIDAFGRLCHLFRETGRLQDTVRSSIEEQVAKFLLILSHNWKNRAVKSYFLRSGETVSRHFHKVLEALISLEDQFIRQPDGSEVPLEIRRDSRFWPYFKDCVGAIDGSHFRVKVAKEDVKRYRGRKEFPTQNVLAACTFDLKFTYILAGWEGSAPDFRMLNSALIRQDKIFVPQGKYYLVDAGFMLRSGFLTPFRSTRCHPKEYSVQRPENSHELYNHRHSLLRNAIERAFGVMNKRFPILDSGTGAHYQIETQKEIIHACSILHNYLMSVDPDEALIAQVDQEVLNHVGDDAEEAPIMSDDEEYRRGEIIRQRITDEMWGDF